MIINNIVINNFYKKIYFNYLNSNKFFIYHICVFFLERNFFFVFTENFCFNALGSVPLFNLIKINFFGEQNYVILYIKLYIKIILVKTKL